MRAPSKAMQSASSDHKKESAIQKLSKSQKGYLREATDRYRLSLPGSPAEDYLKTRGLVTPNPEAQSAINKFGLGYVEDPVPGHEMYRGRLAIPYMRWSQGNGWSVVQIRFRCITDHEHKGHGKYVSVAGDHPWLFNTAALINHSPFVAITEGEIDAITSQVCGIPTVGVPGSQMWQPYFRELFLGYRDVFILADGDEAGMEFANTVARTLPNSKIIPMPPTQDVNSLFMSRGKSALLERIRT